MPRARPLLPALLLAATSLALCASCVTRTHRETVFDQDLTEVRLRSQSKRGEPVARGFTHPSVIAPVRLAHILSRIDVRTEVKKGSERRPAIPTRTLYAIADGLAKGLAAAKPDQEVVVLSIENRKSLAIFDRHYLTSFVAYAQGDELYIHLGHVDFEVPVHREKPLPEPKVGETVMKFRVVSSTAMIPVDAQSLAVSWRDPIFQSPTRVRTLPGGRVVRQQILMESPETEGESAGAAEFPDGLSPSTLRRLADLEEERREGRITEGEYDTRRREILGADPAAAE